MSSQPRPPQDPLDDRPDEQARRDQHPQDAAEESADLVENETEQGTDLPPQEEAYGGLPDERARRSSKATDEAADDAADDAAPDRSGER